MLSCVVPGCFYVMAAAVSSTIWPFGELCRTHLIYHDSISQLELIQGVK